MYDESRRGGVSPVSILCLYGNNSAWTITAGLPQPQLSLQRGITVLPDGSMVVVGEETGLLTLYPYPMSTLTFLCQHTGSTRPLAEQIQIIVIPGWYLVRTRFAATPVSCNFRTGIPDIGT